MSKSSLIKHVQFLKVIYNAFYFPDRGKVVLLIEYMHIGGIFELANDRFAIHENI